MERFGTRWSPLEPELASRTGPHPTPPRHFRLSISVGNWASLSAYVGATCSSLELQVAPPAFNDIDRLSGIGPMSGKVGATCSSLELQVAPPAFTDTDEWASMKQFEKLATQAIRIEFPNSTNAIRRVYRLAHAWGEDKPM